MASKQISICQMQTIIDNICVPGRAADESGLSIVTVYKVRKQLGWKRRTPSKEELAEIAKWDLQKLLELLDEYGYWFNVSYKEAERLCQ